MPQSAIFSSSTPNINLPLLSPGQAQKEFFINQALGILDALHGNTVNASQPTPPETAAEGACFRVTDPAAAAWTGYEDHIAIRIGEDWHFVAPREGMRLFDSGADQILFFKTGWHFAEAPAVPSTGAVIDSEARATLNQLVQVLRDIAILGPAEA